MITPGFLPGFAASVDYYDIKLQGAIGTVTAQTTTLRYEQSIQAFCNNITTGTGGVITGITLIPFNFAAQRLRRVDTEASYRTPVGPGNSSLGGLVTRYISNKTDNGIDFPFEGAGVNVGAFTPSWNYRLTTNYELQNFGFNLTGRGFGASVYDNSFIECPSGCPVSTVKNRTINDNHIAGIFYLDASLTYRFEVRDAEIGAFCLSATFSIRIRCLSATARQATIPRRIRRLIAICTMCWAASSAWACGSRSGVQEIGETAYENRNPGLAGVNGAVRRNAVARRRQPGAEGRSRRRRRGAHQAGADHDRPDLQLCRTRVSGGQDRRISRRNA